MAHFCEQYLIGIEPNPKIMLDWVLENEAKITIQVIQTRFGEMFDPTEQIERLGSDGRAVQNCPRTTHERWELVSTIAVAMALRHGRDCTEVLARWQAADAETCCEPQRVKFEDAQCCKRWEKKPWRYNKTKP